MHAHCIHSKYKRQMLQELPLILEQECLSKSPIRKEDNVDGLAYYGILNTFATTTWPTLQIGWHTVITPPQV